MLTDFSYYIYGKTSLFKLFGMSKKYPRIGGLSRTLQNLAGIEVTLTVTSKQYQE